MSSIKNMYDLITNNQYTERESQATTKQKRDTFSSHKPHESKRKEAK